MIETKQLKDSAQAVISGATSYLAVDGVTALDLAQNLDVIIKVFILLTVASSLISKLFIKVKTYFFIIK